MYVCVCTQINLCIYTHVRTTVIFPFRINLKFALWKVLMNKSLGTVHHITVRGRPFLLFSSSESSTSKRRHLWALQDSEVRLFVSQNNFVTMTLLIWKKKTKQTRHWEFYCSLSATGLFSFLLKWGSGKQVLLPKACIIAWLNCKGGRQGIAGSCHLLHVTMIEQYVATW